MIAASLFLALALYCTATVVIKAASAIASKRNTDLLTEVICGSISWAMFYYLTHA